ncbi:MAG: teichoic acids export ABC transporter ATP-binding subunit TagH, partial [Clostridium sp.]
METNEYSVIADGISKCYKMYSGPREKLVDLLSPKGAGKDFYALKNLSFKVKKGDVVGLLGLNGAGKSTLSNILGGVSLPTKGEIKIEGEASVIAIGIGLNNFLTGMENIEVKALMMGYKNNEIEKIKEDVISFADIGDFINQPIRTYSSGMRSRLGFAISIHTNPDILVIDEALSVGDPTFTQKCLVKMNEFKNSGRTIFFVSHSIEQVRKFCNKAMWLEYGVLREYGDVAKVANNYDAYIKTMNTMTDYEKKFYKRMIIENQEHSLLKDFKVISQKLKKVCPEGKIIKFVTLVNKEINTKVIAYNFDIYTFIFGALPSLIRKRLDISIEIM